MRFKNTVNKTFRKPHHSIKGCNCYESVSTHCVMQRVLDHYNTKEEQGDREAVRVLGRGGVGVAERCVCLETLSNRTCKRWVFLCDCGTPGG